MDDCHNGESEVDVDGTIATTWLLASLSICVTGTPWGVLDLILQ